MLYASSIIRVSPPVGSQYFKPFGRVTQSNFSSDQHNTPGHFGTVHKANDLSGASNMPMRQAPVSASYSQTPGMNNIHAGMEDTVFDVANGGAQHVEDWAAAVAQETKPESGYSSQRGPADQGETETQEPEKLSRSPHPILDSANNFAISDGEGSTTNTEEIQTQSTAVMLVPASGWYPNATSKKQVQVKAPDPVSEPQHVETQKLSYASAVKMPIVKAPVHNQQDTAKRDVSTGSKGSSSSKCEEMMHKIKGLLASSPHNSNGSPAAKSRVSSSHLTSPTGSRQGSYGHRAKDSLLKQVSSSNNKSSDKTEAELATVIRRPKKAQYNALPEEWNDPSTHAGQALAIPAEYQVDIPEGNEDAPQQDRYQSQQPPQTQNDPSKSKKKSKAKAKAKNKSKMNVEDPNHYHQQSSENLGTQTAPIQPHLNEDLNLQPPGP